SNLTIKSLYENNNITLSIVLNFLWNKIDRIKDFILIKLSLIFDSLLSEGILKIIIILCFTKKIVFNSDIFDYLKEFTRNIKEFSYKDLIVRLDGINKENDKQIEEIKCKQKKGQLEEEEAEEAINEIKKKKELSALMVDNPLIVRYLNEFIRYKSECIVIPINMVPKKVKLHDLQKIFLYDVNRSSIKIIGLNKNNEKLIIEAFNELLCEEIISCSE
ncbi:MAG: hypothetical protein KZY61_09600, partial [Clostridiaceae bacterium]|nr:hypothetical protein [Clostridiaceae bacterium]